MRIAPILVLALSQILVAACGGGGGSVTVPLPDGGGDAAETADVAADAPTPDGTPDVGTPDGDNPVDGAETNSDAAEVVLGDAVIGDTVGPQPDAIPDALPGDVAADVPTDPITFTEVFETVLAGEAGCSGGYCHGGGAGGLLMTDETGTHFALVNQSAIVSVCGLTQLVVPGDPESSILWRRARPMAWDGGDACAGKMPYGSDLGLVDEGQAQLLFDWIEEGALP
jgi:hypothetical protein